MDILGSREAAEYLNMTRGTFWQRLSRTRKGTEKHPLPEPRWTLACGPIWTREQLDEWKAEVSTSG
jgi:hypothetical protein